MVTLPLLPVVPLRLVTDPLGAVMPTLTATPADGLLPASAFTVTYTNCPGLYVDWLVLTLMLCVPGVATT